MRLGDAPSETATATSTPTPTSNPTSTSNPDADVAPAPPPNPLAALSREGGGEKQDGARSAPARRRLRSHQRRQLRKRGDLRVRR
jgi:hypothetical protein